MSEAELKQLLKLAYLDINYLLIEGFDTNVKECEMDGGKDTIKEIEKVIGVEADIWPQMDDLNPDGEMTEARTRRGELEMAIFKTTTTKPTYIEYEIKAQDEQHANDLLEQYIKDGTDKSTGDVYVVPTGYSFTGDETIQPEDMELDEVISNE